MFHAWRYQLKEAQTALDQGRLEDAARIFERERLDAYAQGKQFQLLLADRLSGRGAARAAAGDFAAAWRDLGTAREIAGETHDWQAARRAILHEELGVVQKQWRAGDFRGAWSNLEALEKRAPQGGAWGTLKEVSRRLESARKLAVRGKFADAEEQYAAAATLNSDLLLPNEMLLECRQFRATAKELEEQLHRALTAGDWQAVLATADQLLAIAPDSPLARETRRRAWAEVGARLEESQAGARHETPSSTAPPRAPRFILWIDAVGGYLICLGSQITIGQAQPTFDVDVPIQADISRKHVRITREPEGYLLEPLAATKINGREAAGLSLLRDGDEIELNAVKLRFRRPHAYSASARLEFVSRHRTKPFADGVVLMADSCILGPDPLNHVVCRGWPGNVILFRDKEALICRATESLEIDGKLIDGRGKIELNSSVVGASFAMKLEAL